MQIYYMNIRDIAKLMSSNINQDNGLVSESGTPTGQGTIKLSDAALKYDEHIRPMSSELGQSQTGGYGLLSDNEAWLWRMIQEGDIIAYRSQQIINTGYESDWADNVKNYLVDIKDLEKVLGIVIQSDKPQIDMSSLEDDSPINTNEISDLPMPGANNQGGTNLGDVYEG